jgi:hypothetical protein
MRWCVAEPRAPCSCLAQSVPPRVCPCTLLDTQCPKCFSLRLHLDLSWPRLHAPPSLATSHVTRPNGFPAPPPSRYPIGPFTLTNTTLNTPTPVPHPQLPEVPSSGRTQLTLLCALATVLSSPGLHPDRFIEDCKHLAASDVFATLCHSLQWCVVMNKCGVPGMVAPTVGSSAPVRWGMG